MDDNTPISQEEIQQLGTRQEAADGTTITAPEQVQQSQGAKQVALSRAQVVQQQADQISQPYKNVNFYDPANGGALNELNQQLQPLGISATPSSMDRASFQRTFADGRQFQQTAEGLSWFKTYTQEGDRLDKEEAQQSWNKLNPVEKLLSPVKAIGDGISNLAFGTIKSLWDIGPGALVASVSNDLARNGLILNETGVDPSDLKANTAGVAAGYELVASVTKGFNWVGDQVERRVLAGDTYWQARQDHAVTSNTIDQDLAENIYKPLGLDPVKDKAYVMSMSDALMMSIPLPGGGLAADAKLAGARLASASVKPFEVAANRAADNLLQLQVQHEGVKEFMNSDLIQAVPGAYKNMDELTAHSVDLASQVDAQKMVLDQHLKTLTDATSMLKNGGKSDFTAAYKGTELEGAAKTLDDIIAAKRVPTPVEAAQINKLGEVGVSAKPSFTSTALRGLGSVASGAALGFMFDGFKGAAMGAIGEGAANKFFKRLAPAVESSTSALNSNTARLAGLQSALTDAKVAMTTAKQGVETAATRMGTTAGPAALVADGTTAAAKLAEVQNLKNSINTLERSTAGNATESNIAQLQEAKAQHATALSDWKTLSDHEANVTAHGQSVDAHQTAQDAVNKLQTKINSTQAQRAVIAANVAADSKAQSGKLSKLVNRTYSAAVGVPGVQTVTSGIKKAVLAVPGYKRPILAGVAGGTGAVALNSLDPHPDYSNGDAFLAGAIGSVLGRAAFTRLSIDDHATFLKGNLIKVTDGSQFVKAADTLTTPKVVSTASPTAIGEMVHGTEKVPYKDGAFIYDKSGQLQMQTPSVEHALETVPPSTDVENHSPVGTAPTKLQGTTDAGELTRLHTVNDQSILSEPWAADMNVYHHPESGTTVTTATPLASAPEGFASLGRAGDVSKAGGIGGRIDEINANPGKAAVDEALAKPSLTTVEPAVAPATSVPHDVIKGTDGYKTRGNGIIVRGGGAGVAAGAKDDKFITAQLNATGGEPTTKRAVFVATTGDRTGQQFVSIGNGSRSVPEQLYNQAVGLVPGGKILLDGKSLVAVDAKGVRQAIVKTASTDQLSPAHFNRISKEALPTENDMTPTTQAPVASTEAPVNGKLQERVDENNVDQSKLTNEQQAVLDRDKSTWSHADLRTAVTSVTQPVGLPGYEGLRQSENYKTLNWVKGKPGSGLATANIPVLDASGNVQMNAGKPVLARGPGGGTLLVYGDNIKQMNVLAAKNQLIGLKVH